jgi:hypothetical protein
VKGFVPDYEKTRIDMKFETDQENGFMEVMKTFKIKPEVTFSDSGKEIYIKGRLANCALEDESMWITGEYDQKESIMVQPSASLVLQTQNYYNDVAKAWKAKTKLNWQNELHKILEIGNILKEKAIGKRIDPAMDLTVAFKKFFSVDGTEMVNVTLREFQSEQDFKEQVMAPVEEIFETRAMLKKENLN